MACREVLHMGRDERMWGALLQGRTRGVESRVMNMG